MILSAELFGSQFDIEREIIQSPVSLHQRLPAPVSAIDKKQKVNVSSVSRSALSQGEASPRGGKSKSAAEHTARDATTSR